MEEGGGLQVRVLIKSLDMNLWTKSTWQQALMMNWSFYCVSIMRIIIIDVEGFSPH